MRKASSSEEKSKSTFYFLSPSGLGQTFTRIVTGTILGGGFKISFAQETNINLYFCGSPTIPEAL